MTFDVFRFASNIRSVLSEALLRPDALCSWRYDALAVLLRIFRKDRPRLIGGVTRRTEHERLSLRRALLR